MAVAIKDGEVKKPTVVAKGPSIWKNLVAGSVAGVAGLVLCHPLDLVRTRLQTSTRYSGPIDCFTRTVREEGVRGMYKGMASPLAAQALYKSVIFGAISVAQSGVIAMRPKDYKQVGPYPFSISEQFVFGAVAGGINSFVVTPVELVRNRLIVQYASSPSPSSVAVSSVQAAGVATSATTAAKPHYSGPISLVRSVVADKGITGMWRGLSSTLTRDVPGVAAWYATNEAVKRALMAQSSSKGAPSAAILLTSGAAAGVAFWTVSMPFDSIKSLIQVDITGQYRGFFDCARQVCYTDTICLVFFMYLNDNFLFDDNR
jgi:hypothetical protein